jgi:hypothetical protein
VVSRLRERWPVDGFIELLKLCAPPASKGAGPSTTYSRNLPWIATAALL